MEINNTELDQKVTELSLQIKGIKRRLITKHGPKVAKSWQNRWPHGRKVS